MTQTGAATASDRETVHELVQDLLGGINADLETGTHHGNNEASREWVKKHPYLMRSLNALCAYVDQWGPK